MRVLVDAASDACCACYVSEWNVALHWMRRQLPVPCCIASRPPQESLGCVGAALDTAYGADAASDAFCCACCVRGCRCSLRLTHAHLSLSTQRSLGTPVVASTCFGAREMRVRPHIGRQRGGLGVWCVLVWWVPDGASRTCMLLQGDRQKKPCQCDPSAVSVTPLPWSEL